MRRLLAPALVLTLACAGPAPVAAQRLQDAGVARLLGSLWQRGDASGVVGLVAGSGLEIEIEGVGLGHLGGRRAAAALRQLFRSRQTVNVRPGPLTLVAGTDDHAFVELDWRVRPAGGLAVERTTVFVGLVREPSGWKVSQIRVLP
jgi:hypothetical protein